MVFNVDLWQDEPRELITGLYNGAGVNCKAHRVIDIIFNILDVEANNLNNENTGIWKDKAWESDILGIYITVSKRELIEFIDMCGWTPSLEKQIPHLDESKKYVIWADGD